MHFLLNLFSIYFYWKFFTSFNIVWYFVFETNETKNTTLAWTKIKSIPEIYKNVVKFSNQSTFFYKKKILSSCFESLDFFARWFQVFRTNYYKTLLLIDWYFYGQWKRNHFKEYNVGDFTLWFVPFWSAAFLISFDARQHNINVYI